MPDHIYQHIWTYLMGAYVVPMMLNKALLFPSKVEKWVILVLAGIFWPITLLLIFTLVAAVTIIEVVKGVFRRVAHTGAKVYQTLRKEERNRHHFKG